MTPPASSTERTDPGPPLTGPLIGEHLMEPLLLTPVQAARMLGIGRSKLYELLAKGQLESVRIGNCRRVPAQALHNFLARLSAAG